MATAYELFRVRGIAVKLHSSFVLLVAFMALLAMGGPGGWAAVGWRLLAPLLLFVTVILHELGHALVAQRLGVGVIDVVLTPLGGMARLPGTMTDSRKEIAIAAAGPMTNLAIAGLVLGIGQLSGGLRADALYDWRIDRPLEIFYVFNAMLGLFNLIPAFPMDGGRILRGTLALRIGLLRATRIACRLGLWIALGCIVTPFVLWRAEWWFLPFVGLFLIWVGLKERIAIEAREGILKAADGIRFGFRTTGTTGATGGPPPDADRDATGRTSGPSVIDVAGTSRLVDDGEERE